MRFSDEAVQQYTDTAVEFRARLLGTIETAIENEEIDPTEGIQTFAKITLLPKDFVLNYVGSMGNPKLWRNILK